MSRIGKQPIQIPPGVTVSVNGNHCSVRGPKGELAWVLHPHAHITTEEKTLHIQVRDPKDIFDRSLWGLSQRLIANMITGVTEGFEKKLELNGVGYKVAVSGATVTLHLGFSHPIEFTLPKGIEAKVEKNTLTISGIDKQLVGETAARIRAFRKPEPYKGKGIRYVDEVIRKKAGKAAKAGAK